MQEFFNGIMVVVKVCLALILGAISSGVIRGLTQCSEVWRWPLIVVMTLLIGAAMFKKELRAIHDAQPDKTGQKTV
jgi:hypothetical protein